MNDQVLLRVVRIEEADEAILILRTGIRQLVSVNIDELPDD